MFTELHPDCLHLLQIAETFIIQEQVSKSNEELPVKVEQS